MKLARRSCCLVAQLVCVLWLAELGAGEDSAPAIEQYDMLQREIEEIPQEVLEMFQSVEEGKPKQEGYPRHTGISGIRPRGFKPDSSCQGSSNCGPPSRDLDFPPGRPNANNIGNICLFGSQRPRYGPHSLPQTGMSHLRRHGDAINKMEDSFADCCRKPDKLSCAEKEWNSALNKFCEEEFSIKTRPYHCCKKLDSERATCFERDAPSPNYDLKGLDPITEERTPSHVIDINIGGPLCFTSPAGECITRMTLGDQRSMYSGVSFPPGEPTESNLKNICKFRKFRPRYNHDSMPSTGDGSFQRQTEALNRLEDGYKRCCKGLDILTCAKAKWKDVLKKFCREEFSVKTKWHGCCLEKVAKQLSCFARYAPYPNYDREIQTIDLGTPTNAALEILCGHFKLVTKQLPVVTLVKGIKQKCCPAATDERMQCVMKEKEALADMMCSRNKQSDSKAGKYWKDCCSRKAPAREDCFRTRFLSKVSVVFAQKVMQGEQEPSLGAEV